MNNKGLDGGIAVKKAQIFTHKILQAPNHKCHVSVFFCELPKVSDCIIHGTLMITLPYYRIKRNVSKGLLHI
jgi:hypothetical protein